MERSDSWGKYSKSLEQVYEEVMDELYLEYHGYAFDEGDGNGGCGDVKDANLYSHTGEYNGDLPAGIPIGKMVL